MSEIKETDEYRILEETEMILSSDEITKDGITWERAGIVRSGYTPEFLKAEPALIKSARRKIGNDKMPIRSGDLPSTTKSHDPEDEIYVTVKVQETVTLKASDFPNSIECPHTTVLLTWIDGQYRDNTLRVWNLKPECCADFNPVKAKEFNWTYCPFCGTKLK